MADLKVKPGDPVSARAWNQIVDLLPTNSAGFGVAGGFSGQVILRAKNVSGTDREIGQLLTVSAWAGISDASNPHEVVPNMAWEADDITWHSDIHKLVVCAEPIPDQEIGSVVVSGPCIVKLKSGETDAPYAFIDPQTPTQMILMDAGVARVLHKFTEDYAVVILGDRQPYFRYQLSEASQAPSSTTATLEHLDGTTITGSTIELEDPLSFMDDQASGDEGTCLLVGNKFYAVQAECT